MRNRRSKLLQQSCAIFSISCYLGSAVLEFVPIQRLVASEILVTAETGKSGMQVILEAESDRNTALMEQMQQVQLNPVVKQAKALREAYERQVAAMDRQTEAMKSLWSEGCVGTCPPIIILKLRRASL